MNEILPILWGITFILILLGCTYGGVCWAYTAIKERMKSQAIPDRSDFERFFRRFPPVKTHPLFDAAWDDSPERLQALLDEGSNLYEVSPAGSALSGAIDNDSMKAFNFLLDYGVDPNHLIGSHLPLNIAIDKEITDSSCGTWTHGLIDNDDLRPIPVFSQALLMHGANPDLKDPWGTPIEYAKARHHHSFLDLLGEAKDNKESIGDVMNADRT